MLSLFVHETFDVYRIKHGYPAQSFRCDVMSLNRGCGFNHYRFPRTIILAVVPDDFVFHGKSVSCFRSIYYNITSFMFYYFGSLPCPLSGVFLAIWWQIRRIVRYAGNRTQGASSK